MCGRNLLGMREMAKSMSYWEAMRFRGIPIVPIQSAKAAAPVRKAAPAATVAPAAPVVSAAPVTRPQAIKPPASPQRDHVAAILTAYRLSTGKQRQSIDDPAVERLLAAHRLVFKR
jgi:hypothetical protein